MTQEYLNEDAGDYDMEVENDPSQAVALKGNGHATLPPSDAYRSADGYEPGAIRRIVLLNFVTYSHAEFTIGPSLNMIIGPNGSGKSTIVCAICLGLGGKPDVLGRAKSPTQFIKHGQTSAIITLELQGHKNERNVVVTRIINANNTSHWKINERHATQADVLKKVAEFNIQINNLCQFLPQDRVANFAQLPSTDLLLETERAVGERSLIEQHHKLIELDRSRNLDEESLTNEKKILEEKEKQQAQDQEIIDKIAARRKNEARSQVLSAGLVALEYRSAREVVATAKQKHGAVEVKYKDLAQRSQAFEQKKDGYVELGNQIRAAQMELKSKRRVNHTRIEDERDKLWTLANEIKNTRAAMDSLQSQKTTRKQEKKVIEDQLKAIDNMLQQNVLPSEEEELGLREEYSQALDKNRAVNDEINKEKGAISNLSRKKDSIRREMHRCEMELKDLDSDQQLRLRFLQRESDPLWQNVYRAAEWLRKNKEKFSQRIYEPPILSLTYRQPKLLKFLNATIDKNSMATFTALNREDYLTFGKLVSDNLQINVPIKEFSGTFAPTLQDQVSTAVLSEDEMKKFGFDGSVLALIAGPMPVLNMLCHTSKIHLTPYSSVELSTAQIACIDDHRDRSGNPVFTKYMDLHYLCNSIRSNYGNRNLSSSKIPLSGAPKYFVVAGQNQARIKEVKAEIEQLHESGSKLDEEIGTHSQEITELQARQAPIKVELAELSERKHKFQAAKSQDAMMKQKRTQTLSRLQDFDEDIPESQYDRLEDDVRRSIEQINARSTYLTTLLKKDIEVTRMYQNSLAELDSVNNAAACYDRYAMTGLKELEEQLQEAANYLLRATDRFKAAKHAVKSSRKTMTDEQTAEVKAIYEDVAVTAETLQEELNQVQAVLQSSDDNLGESTVRRHEKRQQEINELQDKIADLEKMSERLYGEIESIRSHWQPELEKIVATISEAFSDAFKRINCRGEVRLGHTDQPFSDWSIDIMVSFREGTDLQVLTHQLQSGGERAVSTIFYLISLQRITKSPFRVVDEINQGMDPRNERVVHGHMVHVACEENSSQYFLVTPKLLQDLEYHPKMKVHIIYSGNKVEDVSGYEHPPTSLKALLQKQIRRNEEEAAAAA